jgi:DNA-directed RNA polymerase subunit alpha
MRVGDRTDYNRLRFFIETDGTISPKEALEKSIEIMIKHLKAIVGFKEEEEIVYNEEEVVADGEEKNEKKEDEETEVLKTRIEDLPFSSRTTNILSEVGIRTLGGLSRKKESDLLEIKGVGKKVIQEIKKALAEHGFLLKE